MEQQRIDDMEYEVQANLKKNMVLSTIDGALYAMGAGMIPIGTVLIYYIGNFTDSKLLIGMLNTIYCLMYFAPQLIFSKKMQSQKYYKPLTSTLGLFARIPWLLIGIFTLLLAKNHPSLYVFIFYLLIAVCGLITGVNDNSWLVLLARIIPDDKMAGFLLIRSSICGILDVVGASMSGIILSYGKFPDNYGYLFIVAFIILMTSLIAFNFTEEPKNVTVKAIKMDNQSYMKSLRQILLKDKNFITYLLSTGLIGGFGMMSLIFQVIYAKEKLEISPQQVAALSTVMFITQTCGYILWGFMVKRKGLKFTGTVSAALFIPAILLTLWMHDFGVLILAVAFMSLAQSYRNACENKILINLAPEQGILPTYIGLRNTLMAPFFALNSMFAGLLLDASNFMVLSVISLAFMATGVLLFAFKLKIPE